MGKSSKTRRPYGSGSVRDLGDGRWEVCAYGGRRADGSPRRARRVVHGTSADAERELVRLRVEMGRRPNMGDAMTLDDYFEGVFVPVREACIERGGDNVIVTRSTLDTYESVYRTHISPAFGEWPADTIGRADVQRWVATLPSAACADKAFRHLRAILRAMWDDELLDEEPLRRRVRLPRHQLSPKGVWSPDELAEALERLRGHQLEGLVLAMAGGGLRREEALALDLPGDLEPSTMTGADGRERVVCRLVVSKAWTDGEGQREVTKTHRVRPVTIGEPFSVRLMAVCADGRPKLLMRADGRAPMMPGSASETWRRAFESGPLQGMRYVELRTLRHCHETIAAGAGMSDSTVASLHGHSQQVMYDHYLALAQRDADAMAEAVAGAMARRTSSAM